MTQAEDKPLKSEVQQIFITSDEDRQTALAQAAEEASFAKDLTIEVVTTAINILLLVLLYVVFEQGLFAGLEIFGLIIALIVAIILFLRLVRSIRGLLIVLTYRRVAVRTGTPYARTLHNCAFLQQLPFRFICTPRPLTKFPEELLFRCHVKSEWEACQKEIIPELIDYLKENENSVVKARAAWGLGVVGSSDAIPALIEGLNESDPNVQLICTWSLGNIGDEQAVNPLVGLFSSNELKIRSQASQSLIEIGESACPRLIEEGNASSDKMEILSLVIATLGKIGCEEALPFLIAKLEAEDDLVQLEAAYSLGDTQHQDAVAPLLQLTTSEDDFLRMAALDSLAKLSHLTLLGLIEYLDAGGEENIAHEIIFRMEDEFDKALEKLRDLGKDEDITKLEQLLGLATPPIISNS
ncbi:MAG: HEAT repeat domain-containing protein [Candidatus Heimdallarchaeota archaeon]